MSHNTFHNVSYTVKGHFILNFYAAIYFLIRYIRSISKTNDDFNKMFEKYPFLSKYFTEMCEHMPEKITWEDDLRWWAEEITAWEKTGNEPLPLRALTEQGGLNFDSRIALVLVGLVEEDSRFGTLFEDLQAPLSYRRPCLELVTQVMKDGSYLANEDPWNICQLLLSKGLVEASNMDAPMSEWVLRVPLVIWDVFKGEFTKSPVSWNTYIASETFPKINDLFFPQEFLEHVEMVPDLLRDGRADAVVLRGMQKSERIQVMGSVARTLDYNIIKIETPNSLSDQNWKWLGPLCLVTRSMPVMVYDMDPGETVELPRLIGYKGPVGILAGFEGGFKGKAVEKAMALTLPALKTEQRRSHWQSVFRGNNVEQLSEISERFHMPGGYIRQAGAMAKAYATLDRRKTVTMGDVREACRSLNRQLLDTLAVRLEAEGSWDRLVVSEIAGTKLLELELRCRHRERLMENLGPAFDSGINRGVRALFSGASGTGKTLAAKILAAELEMDIYRVDLAAVVNKYIGETEKNLNRVLSRAEELDVMLLLDEGDALMGRRTEVRSANDRYANLETDYLLQRLENYQGIVVVTTNAGENIDNAFQRRMDVVVDFISPQAQERWQIWQLHLPSNHAVDHAYLEEVAVRCAITGGQIRNAALQATLLALDEGRDIERRHLEQAIQSEYRKAGAVCPLTEKGKKRDEYNGMEAFLDALSY